MIYPLSRVYAVNRAGQSEVSEESEVVVCKPKLKSPDAPTDLKVAGTTKTTIKLRWEKPINDGGSEITGYILQNRLVRRQAWHDVAKVFH